MMNIIFENQGELDERSIRTFGVSSKENDNAIGYFGTGLKYAIAILLRNQCSIEIFSGTKRYTFAVKKETLRKDEFNFVTMNDIPLAFTTELGKNWELWQAFREIYCNCKDEMGNCYASETIPEPEAGKTIIVVNGKEFFEVFRKKSEIILEKKPIYSGEYAEMCEGPSNFIYYKGIQVMKLGKPSLYTYNITANLDLTEDRSVKYQWYIDDYLSKLISGMNDEELVERCVLAEKDFFETTFSSFHASEFCSPAFRTIVSREIKKFNPKLNAFAKSRISAVILDEAIDGQTMDMSEMDKKRMEKAIAFCKAINFHVDEYPIIVSQFLGEHVLGMAHKDRIYIADRTMMMGTKMLAGTLIEEYIHLKYSLYDETRSMQNFLFDKIVSMGETILGDIL